MVKIENEYGDRYKGKSSNAIYQDHYGKQIRRKSYKQTKPPTPKQLETRQRFKEAIQTIKSLSYNQIQDIKKFYNILKEKDPRKYPVNWYNFAKWLCIKQPKTIILNQTNKEYKINHINIYQVIELSSNNVPVYDSGQLSTPSIGSLLQNFQKIPSLGAVSLKIYPVDGIYHTFQLEEKQFELLFFDSRFFDSRFFA